MTAMIDVRSLSKRYGAFEALKAISFQVGPAEIVGFLGPNGAGKTTTLKVLTGFVSPSGGSASVAGFDVVEASIEARRRIGYLPESAPSYVEMRVIDYLDFIGRMRAMAPAQRVVAIERVAEECELTDRLYQVIGTLSKGYRQRVGLSVALLHQPEVLVLDEPTSGLDPNQILVIRNLIRKIGASRTVILSTHILAEVQATCDRVLIIHQGQLVADAPTGELDAAAGGRVLVRVTYTAGTVRLRNEVIHAAIEAVSGVTRVVAQASADGEHGFEVLADRDVRPDLFQIAVSSGLVLVELQRERSTLESVFRRLTVVP